MILYNTFNSHLHIKTPNFSSGLTGNDEDLTRDPEYNYLRGIGLEVL